MSRSDKPWFIGCACDSKFAEHTAVMLTSLDENGTVPEANVLVASFGLSFEDRATIRAGAGRLGPNIQFVEVTAEMMAQLTDIPFRLEYPLPVLGRLFLPEAITSPGARLLTLDSDMIVNQSVRPLFELDMHDTYLGAVHDVPRAEDPDYFNSGLMLIDVDRYKEYDVSGRALHWIAAQTNHPTFPDQDALNFVVGHKWYRLDRSYNWFYTGPDRGDKPLRLEHYQAARVAHFAGGKPWNYYEHAGRDHYRLYLGKLRQRKERARLIRDAVDELFVLTALEVFLGEDVCDDSTMGSLLSKNTRGVISALVGSVQFVSSTLVPWKSELPFAWGDARPLRQRHKAWVSTRLFVMPATSERIRDVQSWHELFSLLFSDELFVAKYGLEQVLALAKYQFDQRSEIQTQELREQMLTEIQAEMQHKKQADQNGLNGLRERAPQDMPRLHLVDKQPAA